MKKLLVIAASLLIAVSAHAQFGVVAGMTSSRSNLKGITKDNVMDNVTQYHVGLTYKFNVLGKALAIQPSILYNVKGSEYNPFEKGGNDITAVDFKNGFLEIPVQLQLRLFGLGDLAHIYALAEPFVGYAISSTVTTGSVTEKMEWDNFSDKLEYGVGVGAGVELIKHVQVSVRYFWNLGGASNVSWENVKDAVTTKNASGIMASVALLF